MYSLPKLLLCHIDILENGNAAETRRTRTKQFTICKFGAIRWLALFHLSLIAQWNKNVLRLLLKIFKVQKLVGNVITRSFATAGWCLQVNTINRMAIQLRSVDNYYRISGDEIIHCTELLHDKCRQTKWRNFCISLRIPVKATCPTHLSLFSDSRRPSFKAQFVSGNLTRKPKCWSKSALSSDRTSSYFIMDSEFRSL